MDNNIKQIKQRGVLSAGSLLFQSGFSAMLGFAAFFILTLKSNLYLLGIYNTVLAMMAFFNYFSSLGLAAAIIQKKEVDEKDLNTAFIIQTTLSLLVIIVGFFLTNYLFVVYKDLPRSAVYLYWSLLFSFFFLSLKTIPSVLLEKKIQIYKVVLVQLIENLVFYSIVIIMSLMNMDIFSLVVAVVARSLVGVIAIYIMNPWSPKLIFSKSSAKSLLSYGVPFQGNSFLALVKDDLMIIYLGAVIGFEKLSIVTFAKKYAEFSIRLIMDNINRVAFPVFSQFQNDKTLLKKSIEKILFYEALFIFPIIIGSVFIFDNFLKIMPGYYAKWQIALISFYFFSFSALFVSLYSPLINLFNAIGKVKLTLVIMVTLTALNWIFIPPLIKLFGFQGISIAFFIISLSFIFVFIKAKSTVDFSLKNAFGAPVISAIAMTLYLIVVKLWISKVVVNNILLTSLAIVGSASVYFLVIYRIKGRALFDEIKSLINTQRR
ncbi:Polysaccharide biosynthesis protein [Candidatus Roizmanbacteria bacterium]|nr:Polysaccharide biosynthesis protein [Candidatus Roizmanbacteria bacterium]